MLTFLPFEKLNWMNYFYWSIRQFEIPDFSSTFHRDCTQYGEGLIDLITETVSTTPLSLAVTPVEDMFIKLNFLKKNSYSFAVVTLIDGNFWNCQDKASRFIFN